MKKLYSILLITALLLCGCSPKTENPPVSSSPAEATEAPAAKSEFYTKYQEETRRPVAVMVDNDNSAAWPHAGIEEAYMIYEVPVEGGSTRLMAFFYQDGPEKIGPVRSSRHYFLDYVLEHDAIYTHFGYSPRAQADIPALGVNNINGVLGTDANVFWREGGGYHNAFTSMERILDMTGKKEYRTERQKAPLPFATEDAVPAGDMEAKNIKIPYSGFYSSGFSYNEENGTYDKYMNGKLHPLQGDGKIEAKNIVIMQMRTYPLGDGSARINIDTVGSGEGYYISMGKAVPITWEKTARSAKTVWKNEAGEEIALNPGQTWVMLLPSGVSPQIG